MNRKYILRKLMTGIAAVLVMFLAWWLIQKKKTPSTIGDVDVHYQIEDTAAVARVVLTDKTGRSVTLSRTSRGWLVDSQYIADTWKVNFMLDALKRWEVKTPVPKAARDNVIRLMTVGSVGVEVYDAEGRLLKKYQVGGATPDNLGTYVSVKSLDYEPYIMHLPGFHGYLSVRFFADAKEWRTLRLIPFDVTTLTFVGMTYLTEPDKSFAVLVRDGMPQLMDGRGRAIDTVPEESVKAFLMQTSRVTFYQRLPGADPQRLLERRPYLVMIARTSSDSVQVRFYERPLPDGGVHRDIWDAISSRWAGDVFEFQYSSHPWMRWGLPGLRWVTAEAEDR